MGEGWNYSFDE